MIAYLKVVSDCFIFYIILLLKHNSDVSPENSCRPIEFPNLHPVPCTYMSEIICYIRINMGIQFNSIYFVFDRSKGVVNPQDIEHVNI